MVIFPVISPRNQAILTPLFLLLLATAQGATALTKALGETAGAFRTQVQSDPTVMDPRLFLRRYDLVLKLIKKDRLREAAGELAEMREDFTGRSTAYLDYLRARLHLRLGDGLNPARGRSYEWQTTNVSVRPDERYVYFPEKRPSSNTLFIERRQMPYPLEAKADYDKAEALLTHLELSPTALLREAALLSRGDLELSRGDSAEADRLWASFANRYPGSLLAGDVLLRRARLAAWEKRWVDGAAQLRALARLNPGGPEMGLAEEQARLMLSMTNANENAAQQITDLLSRWEKESRLGDELSQVLDALNPVLGAP